MDSAKSEVRSFWDEAAECLGLYTVQGLGSGKGYRFQGLAVGAPFVAHHGICRLGSRFYGLGFGFRVGA